MSGPLTRDPEAARRAMPRDAFMARLDSVDMDGLLGRSLGETLETARRDVEIATRREEALALAAARLFGSAEGRDVLEHILDRTLRAPMTLEGASREQQVDFILRREGANAVAWALLALIARGRDLPPPVRQEAMT